MTAIAPAIIVHGSTAEPCPSFPDVGCAALPPRLTYGLAGRRLQELQQALQLLATNLQGL
jgi:hypothetical protein